MAKKYVRRIRKIKKFYPDLGKRSGFFYLHE